MTGVTRAALDLALTLRAVPGFVGTRVEGRTIVLITTGGVASLRSWAGHPVRTERGP